MKELLILGTDTDVGKTTFSLYWLAVFHKEFAYWKPVETGDSDSEKVRRLVPQAHCFAPAFSFALAAAPPLAASAEGASIPSAAVLVGTKPTKIPGNRHLVIESFGGPFSPLNEEELQIALVDQLRVPTVLVSSSALGAIGRTLKCLYALEQESCKPFAVVLMGKPDPYAAKQIARYGRGPSVFFLEPPTEWEPLDIRAAADRQRETLQAIYDAWLNLPEGHSTCSGAEKPVGKRKQTSLGDDTKVINLVDEDTVVSKKKPPAEHVKNKPSDGAPKPEPVRPEHKHLTEIPRPLSQTSREEKVDTAALLAGDGRVIWHPYTSLRDPDPPLVAVSAQDEFIHLADGRRVIDGISSWWTILHGHRHPVLMNALAQAATHFDHVPFAGMTHPHAIRLAEMLLQTTSWSGGRVFYSDNGSTAVEVALKMAYQFWCHQGEPQRTLFIGFEHGYHGDTFGAMAASRDPVFFGRFEPLLFQTEIIPVDAHRLDQTLSKHRGKVSGVIIEPLVQGAGGMRMHSPEELRALFEVTQRHEVLFIADEVMTGCGRVGPLWAHQLAKISPDLICTAKTLTGGILPLAATLVAPKLVDAWDTDDRSKTFFHGHSFTANPLACAVAVANWEILSAAPPSAPQYQEAFWKQALLRLADHPKVREIRIRGCIAAIELDVPGGYLAEVGRKLRQRCLHHGVFLRPLGNVLYALPPFCTSQSSLERIAEAMIKAID